MEPLKIYLADLTYDTLEGAADSVFPLNVGFVASYCISKFGSKVGSFWSKSVITKVLLSNTNLFPQYSYPTSVVFIF